MSPSLKYITSLLLCVFAIGIIFFQQHSLPIVPVHTIVIDPGHGGSNIITDNKRLRSDRWDPVQKRYLSYYSEGMKHGMIHEHRHMLSLAKRVNYYLSLTRTPWGWQEFSNILRAFSAATQKNFPRLLFLTHMTRQDSWREHYLVPNKQEVNNLYRLYDYPDSRNRNRHGRLSFINAIQPSLVLSLHATPAPKDHAGGMAAVLSPGYRSYNMVRQISSGDLDKIAWKDSLWNGKILPTELGWDQFESMRGDAWVYLHGYRSNQDGTAPNFDAARGIRHNLISWRYRESIDWHKYYNPDKPGPYALNYTDFIAEGRFWDRERGAAEGWRREDGPLGYGGDNHYASDELMRFVQYGVRILDTSMQAAGKIGAILDPYASAYALPIYVNAIVAFLEIAHLNIDNDLDFLVGQQENIAKSLAVGIYSLYAGIQLAPLPESKNPYPPRSQALDFKKYRELPEGNYFKATSITKHRFHCCSK